MLPSTRGRRRVLAWSTAVALVAGLGTGAVVAWPDQPAPGPAAGDAPSIAFLGDSLTVGVGAPPRRGYAWLTAAELGWPIAVVDGVSGSGYLAPGAGLPLPERAAGVVAAEPDVVLVVGGSNDVFQGYPAEEIAAAAAGLFRALRDGLPDATIIAVGPFPTSPDAIGEHPAAAALREAAAGAGVVHLDARDLLDSPSIDLERWDEYISGDGLHPNEHGHRALAGVLAERVRAVVAHQDAAA